jgi:hypothetical protein
VNPPRGLGLLGSEGGLRSEEGLAGDLGGISVVVEEEGVLVGEVEVGLRVPEWAIAGVRSAGG